MPPPESPPPPQAVINTAVHRLASSPLGLTQDKFIVILLQLGEARRQRMRACHRGGEFRSRGKRFKVPTATGQNETSRPSTAVLRRAPYSTTYGPPSVAPTHASCTSTDGAAAKPSPTRRSARVLRPSSMADPCSALSAPA